MRICQLTVLLSSEGLMVTAAGTAGIAKNPKLVGMVRLRLYPHFLGTVCNPPSLTAQFQNLQSQRGCQ
ncbi:hypothetical protein MPLB_1490057 [Mesorhizobium sp. ORS 3324]|nr:hypothetical protein MPLB_1490057 [Mesorhizobium sp. ORS 3324]